jgi:haloacetate dehalogenase
VFEDFEEFVVRPDGVDIHGRRGGEGPPLLLLHGIPQTHLMWHRLAPKLAERFTVVATDLRGYGGSGAPPSNADHSAYSMRTLAADQVAAMRLLGHERFAVVGHDRGARCAYRMALDHPDVVQRLAVLDIVPTGHAYEHADKEFALGYWVWSFLAAPDPVPERLIASAPDVLVNYMLDDWSSTPDAFTADCRRAYVEQFHDPERLHAICEQYRAASAIDVQHDLADLGTRRITAPLLALWSEDGPVDSWYEPLEVWREWAEDVQGGPVRGGHFLPEEAPEAVLAELQTFLGSG